MKFFLFTTLLIFSAAISQRSYSQEKKYETFKVGKFTLEKFPIFYYKKPFKTVTQKVPIIEKIALYQDLNKYGQNDGLRVEMQTDYVSPHTIYYYKNGVVVYAAYFFPNSLKAYEVVNKNLDDKEEGPQIQRHFENGKLIIENKTFKNGEDLSNKPTSVRDKLNFSSEGLLDGSFFWTAKLDHLSGKLQYSGIAKNGVIQKLIIKSTLGERYEQFRSTYVIGDTSITENRITTSGDNLNSSRTILKRIKVANSEVNSRAESSCIYFGDILQYPYNNIGPNYFELFLIKLTEE